MFHASGVHPFRENNDELFPTRALRPSAPITINRQQESFIDKIVDERQCGRNRNTSFVGAEKVPKATSGFLLVNPKIARPSTGGKHGRYKKKTPYEIKSSLSSYLP